MIQEIVNGFSWTVVIPYIVSYLPVNSTGHIVLFQNSAAKVLKIIEPAAVIHIYLNYLASEIAQSQGNWHPKSLKTKSERPSLQIASARSPGFFLYLYYITASRHKFPTMAARACDYVLHQS